METADTPPIRRILLLKRESQVNKQRCIAALQFQNCEVDRKAISSWQGNCTFPYVV